MGKLSFKGLMITFAMKSTFVLQAPHKLHYIQIAGEELRKKYDLYGEDGLKDDHFGGGQNYQSWHYFNEEFGKFQDL